MLSLRQRAKAQLRRAGFISAGTLLCLVGLAFLTLAAWIALSAAFAPLEAALILAAAYMGAGVLLIGIGSHRDEAAAESAPPQTQAAKDAPPIIQAFLYGMQAGARAGSTRR